MDELQGLVDFCVTNGIPQDCAVAKSCNLSSYHSPILITLTADGLNQKMNQSNAIGIQIGMTSGASSMRD
jgi:hypothetical protein